jgi:hypothetical protein
MEATNVSPPISADEISLDKWLQTSGGWKGKRRIAKVSIFKFRFDLIPALRDVDDSPSSDTAKRPDTIAEEPLFAPTRGLTCLACMLSFPDLHSQQLHFKSQLHRVNLSRKLKGQAPLGVEELKNGPEGKGAPAGDAPQEDDDDGSCWDSEEDSEEAAVDRWNVDSEEEEELDSLTFSSSSGSVVKQLSAKYGTTLNFADAQLHWEFSLSAGLFSPNSGLLSREWNRSPLPSRSPWSLFRTYVGHFQASPMSAVFLLRSGRFAGVIFDGSNAILHKVG